MVSPDPVSRVSMEKEEQQGSPGLNSEEEEAAACVLGSRLGDLAFEYRDADGEILNHRRGGSELANRYGLRSKNGEWRTIPVN